MRLPLTASTPGWSGKRKWQRFASSIWKISGQSRECRRSGSRKRLIANGWKAFLRHVIVNSENLRPAPASEAELSLPHVARAVAAGETTVRFSPSFKSTGDVSIVVDWLAGLRERDPRHARKLRKIRFSDAVAMSHRWSEPILDRVRPISGRAAEETRRYGKRFMARLSFARQ
jgi:hypothetical protein